MEGYCSHFWAVNTIQIVDKTDLLNSLGKKYLAFLLRGNASKGMILLIR